MTLDEIEARRVWHVVRRAHLRLQLYVVGATHRRLNELAKEATGIITQQARTDGTLEGMGLYSARTQLDRAWTAWFEEWKASFLDWQEQGAMIPFGALAVYHNQWLLPQIKSLTESQSYTGQQFGEAIGSDELLDFVFRPQLQAVLNAARNRIYKDGLNLSSRLWRLDQESRAGIQNILFQGIANGESAMSIAKSLEQYLGANARCPRWTAARLRLTKADIAGGDRTGLASGDDCRGQGVAYNALRLARNEINAAHAMATDYLFEKMTWIEKEEVRLSPDHAMRDECDAVAGIHPKGTVLLPIHPHCLCYKVAVLIKPSEFTRRLRDWMRGGEWDAMDRYASSVGGDAAKAISTGLLDALLGWAYGGHDGHS